MDLCCHSKIYLVVRGVSFDEQTKDAGLPYHLPQLPHLNQTIQFERGRVLDLRPPIG